MSSRLEPRRGRFLAERFAQHLAERGIRAPSAQDLEGVVDAAITRAQAAWPVLRVDLEGFVVHLASHLPDDTDDIGAALNGLVIEDLYLALACASGEAMALQAFDRAYADELAKATAKLRGHGSGDDARQRVWQRLFVGSAEMPPKILDYSGRGQLRHWYRVTIVRTLLDQLRRPDDKRLSLEEDPALGIAAPQLDPETDYLKRLYRHEFQEAFEAAVQSLSPEDRNVLRSYYVNSLTVDQIAAVFGVHRATAARRVERARNGLLGETRRRLCERLKLSNKELESVIRLIESQLHVSVAKLLA